MPDMMKGLPLPPEVETHPMRHAFTLRPGQVRETQPEIAEGTDHITVDEPSS